MYHTSVGHSAVREVVYIDSKNKAFDILDLFQTGKAHIAIVSNNSKKLLKQLKRNENPTPDCAPCGILTLEDIIEVIAYIFIQLIYHFYIISFSKVECIQITCTEHLLLNPCALAYLHTYSTFQDMLQEQIYDEEDYIHRKQKRLNHSVAASLLHSLTTNRSSPRDSEFYHTISGIESYGALDSEDLEAAGSVPSIAKRSRTFRLPSKMAKLRKSYRTN